MVVPPKVGEACYVAATVQNRRYYGVLVEQEALQAASTLYWQDQTTVMELHRRMRALQQAGSATEAATTSSNREETKTKNQKDAKMNADADNIKEEATITNAEDETQGNDEKTGSPAGAKMDPADAITQDKETSAEKKQETVSMTHATDTATNQSAKAHSRKRPRDEHSNDAAAHDEESSSTAMDVRAVQKFSYNATHNVRTLLATYSSIAAATLDCTTSSSSDGAATNIQKACDNGGGFCGAYYYQYEVRTYVRTYVRMWKACTKLCFHGVVASNRIFSSRLSILFFLLHRCPVVPYKFPRHSCEPHWIHMKWVSIPHWTWEPFYNPPLGPPGIPCPITPPRDNNSSSNNN